MAKIFFKNPDLVYKYNEKVDVPVLGMVDDVLSVTKCSNKTVISNATINSFMELNKLTLSSEKCSKIHIGRKCENCPKLKVHQNEMKNAQREKYLGDIISEKGTIKETIENRISKAWSYVSEIGAILSEFPFGNKKIQVGLMLREAMFLNGVLHSSESWHGITSAQIGQIETVDHQLMKTILSAHCKTPTEFLYLETGALPVKSVIASRRLNYLKHIHMKDEHELVKRIFEAQRDDPKRGDWWLMAKEDMEKFDIDENALKEKTKSQAKEYIKKKIYSKTFENLKDIQRTHSKIKNIRYDHYKIQNYITNPKLKYEEASLLFALRSQTVKNIKCNLKSFSQNDKMCPLCMKSEDTQEHCLQCPKLKNVQDKVKNHIDYNHIFSNCEVEQKAVAALFFTILEARQRLVQEGLPGT